MTVSLASPFLDILACPTDRSPLTASGESLSCASCGAVYEVRNGIPILFEPSKRHLLFDAGADASDIGQKVNKANKDFHDLYAEHYEDKHAGDIFNPKTQERLKKNVEMLYARRQIRSVLDVGCGTGNVLRHLRGELVAGMDISPRSLALARRFTPNVLAGDANALPFKNGSFDAVTAYSLLHHLVDVEGLFKEVSRVLKPGGIFYTDWDPNRNYGWELRLRGRILALPGLRQLKRVVKGAMGSPQSRAGSSDAEQVLSQKREEYELANYHEGKSNPREFNPQAIRAMLGRAGFGDIRIFVFDHQPKGGEHRLYPSGGLNDWIYRRFMTMSAKAVR